MVNFIMPVLFIKGNSTVKTVGFKRIPKTNNHGKRRD